MGAVLPIDPPPPLTPASEGDVLPRRGIEGRLGLSGVLLLLLF